MKRRSKYYPGKKRKLSSWERFKAELRALLGCQRFVKHGHLSRAFWFDPARKLKW